MISEATNAPGRPTHEGQLCVYESPHARGVLLVDKGERDKYGHLVWAALQYDDPVAIDAIKNYRRQGK